LGSGSTNTETKFREAQIQFAHAISFLKSAETRKGKVRIEEIMCLINYLFKSLHSFTNNEQLKFFQVLVHCRTGLSRGPATVAAYFMSSKCVSLADALAFLNACLPTLEISKPLLLYLALLEIELHRMRRNKLLEAGNTMLLHVLVD
jgi:hypothetical protein